MKPVYQFLLIGFLLAAGGLLARECHLSALIFLILGAIVGTAFENEVRKENNQ